MSVPQPAPVIRKSKGSVAAAKDTESMTIKEAFGKGKANTATASDDEEHHANEADHPEAQDNAEEDNGDSMEVL